MANPKICRTELLRVAAIVDKNPTTVETLSKRFYNRYFSVMAVKKMESVLEKLISDKKIKSIEKKVIVKQYHT